MVAGVLSGGRTLPRHVYQTTEMPVPHSIALDFPILHLIIARCIAPATEFSTLTTDSLVLEQLCESKVWSASITWAKVSLGGCPVHLLSSNTRQMLSPLGILHDAIGFSAPSPSRLLCCARPYCLSPGMMSAALELPRHPPPRL